MTRKEGQKLKAGDKVFLINFYALAWEKSIIPLTVVSVRSKYIYVTKCPNSKKAKDIINKDRPIYLAECVYNRNIIDCISYTCIEKTTNDANFRVAEHKVEFSRYIVNRFKGKISSLQHELKKAEADLAKAQRELETNFPSSRREV